jgi:hypothetical protein
MIHGARAVISRLSKHDDRRLAWLKALVARRGFNGTIVALANKTARIASAVMKRGEAYQPKEKFVEARCLAGQTIRNIARVNRKSWRNGRAVDREDPGLSRCISARAFDKN